MIHDALHTKIEFGEVEHRLFVHKDDGEGASKNTHKKEPKLFCYTGEGKKSVQENSIQEKFCQEKIFPNH